MQFVCMFAADLALSHDWPKWRLIKGDLRSQPITIVRHDSEEQMWALQAVETKKLQLPEVNHTAWTADYITIPL